MIARRVWIHSKVVWWDGDLEGVGGTRLNCRGFMKVSTSSMLGVTIGRRALNI